MADRPSRRPDRCRPNAPAIRDKTAAGTQYDVALMAANTAQPEPPRLLLAVATTSYDHLGEEDQLPELVEDLHRVRELLTHPRFGYRHVLLADPRTGADVSVNPTPHALQRGLHAFWTSPTRRPDDLVIVYLAGHGVLADEGEFRLALHDFDPNRPDSSGIPAAELARWLTPDRDRRNLLLLLDTCYAGKASADFARRISLRAGPGILVTAAHPRREAAPGFFTQALTRAMDDPAVAGARVPALPIDELVRIINADPARPHWQSVAADLVGLRDGQPPFLHNPRHRPDWQQLDQLTRNRIEQDLARRHEQMSFFDLRARGVSDVDDRAWRFTGRARVLTDLSTWLGALATDERHRVITGDPGSGKSSVIARLSLLADPDRREQIPDLDLLPSASRPPAGVPIAATIHARGKDSAELLTAIATAVDVTADTVGQLLDKLSGRAQPTLVAIDALDEASDATTVAASIVRPLLDGAGEASPLRLIVGVRDHLLAPLGLRLDKTNGVRHAQHPLDRAVVIDLDSTAYADTAALAAYARRCLRETHPTSAYAAADGRIVDAVAAAVAAAAGRSFLVAYLASLALAGQPLPADPADPAWRASLPRTAGEAMRSELNIRLGEQTQRAWDLLLPLAYAEGDGLPWSDLWAPLATEISGRDYTNTDIEWLRQHAGAYVVEAVSTATDTATAHHPTGTTSRSVYRLFHESLAETLRHPDSAPPTVHAAFDRVLRARIPAGNDGSPQWSAADRYTTTHLATHAAKAGTLATLVIDHRYLLAAEPNRLLTTLSTVEDGETALAALAFRHAAPQLRTARGTAPTSYLHLAAVLVGAHTLADRARADAQTGSWHTVSAAWRPHPPHQVITRHTGGVLAVACARVDGRDVIVSGGDDRTVRVWDAATGTPVGAVLTGHTDSVLAVACARVDGRDVIVSGGADRHGAGVGRGHRHPGRAGADRAHRRGLGGGLRPGRWPRRDRLRRRRRYGAGVGRGHRHPGRGGADRAHRRGLGGGLRPGRWPRRDRLRRRRPYGAGVGRGHRHPGRGGADRAHRPGLGGGLRPGRWP